MSVPTPTVLAVAGGVGESVRFAEAVTNYRTSLYAVGVALVGVLTLWVITDVDWFAGHSTSKAVLEQLGGLLVTTGGLMDWRMLPWTTLIRGAREIDVHLAYGSTWLNTHSVELAEFAKNRRNKMRYFLPDPEDDLAMNVLAERFEYTPEIIRGKVVEAATTIAKLSRDGNADVRVWYRRGAPTFTCYRFDDTVVVTLYQHRVGRAAIPTFVISRGTFGSFFKGDLTAIEQQSHELALNDLLGGRSAGN